MIANNRKDLVGKTFSDLTVIQYAYTEDRRAYWECSCRCGGTKVVMGKLLSNGNTKRCKLCSKQGVNNSF